MDGEPLASSRAAERQFLWRRIPVTVTLVILNFLVFACMGFPIHGLNNGALLNWGAEWGPLSLNGQWWRMFSSLFIHDGLGHLVTNMLCLWAVGTLAEPAFGTKTFAFLYLFSGLTGEISSLAVRPEEVTCGASGAIFGLIGGVLAALIIGRPHRLRERLNLWHVIIVVLAGYSFYAGITDQYVDNAAHIGGLTSGVIMGLLLARNIPSDSDHYMKSARATFGGAAVLLATLIIIVRHQNGYVVPLAAAVDAFGRGDLKLAEKDSMLVLDKKPDDVAANVMLGKVYLEEADYQRSEQHLKRALAANNNHRTAEYLLGLVYLRTERFAEAESVAEDLFRRGALRPELQVLFAAAMDGKGDHVDAGGYYLDLGHYDEAIAAYKKALEVTPDNPRAIQGLIRAYRGKGMNSEADTLQKTIAK